MPYKDPQISKEYHKKWWAEHKEEMKIKRHGFYLSNKKELNKKRVEYGRVKTEKINRSKEFLRKFLEEKRNKKEAENALNKANIVESKYQFLK